MLTSTHSDACHSLTLRPCNVETLRLVDSPPEPEFDKLTLLVRDVIDVPVALISIVEIDKNRQYFKSAQGLPEPWATSRQTPLSHSFCQHVTRCSQLLRVDNAHEDPLVAQNLAVRDLGVVAYLGYPIVDSNGLAIGALCAIDVKPRAWSDQDVSLMARIAECVSDVVCLRSSLLTVQSLNAEQLAFTQALSHDLKAPVNSLHYLLSELQEAFNESNEVDHRELVELGMQATSRMGMQITGLAELHEVLATEFVSSPVNLNEIFEDAISALRGIIQESNAQIELSPLPEVIGSRPLLQSLFQNLIDNAIKFREKGRRPSVKVGVREAGENVEVSVVDNGIGIPDCHFDRIFKMFERLHSQSDYPGTGLGLSICKRIVDMHDGSISIISTPNIGTRFTIKLKRAA
ncbi:Phytochrome-like protein cph1 [Rubripirellula amarantea]|uniref:histidine kinase n=1 Tax=Rubripirellula amarantea TaxID=2527999 RepID=A0A5C5WJL6_9BACT|nr:GAF domain-containing sensor histidine kinase [Rubripirellula amarantea]TWT50211.1 Phytochrome-like protein cph1 [Rubripirellula amarantea]